MKQLTKTFKDYHFYLEEIEERSKKLTPDQQDKLVPILASQITLLIALKHHSCLGKVEYNLIV